MRTPGEVISERFRLHRGPATREDLVQELEGPVPVDEIFGSQAEVEQIIAGLEQIVIGQATIEDVFTAPRAKIPTWEQMERGRDIINQSALPQAERKALLTRFVPGGKDFWNPLMGYMATTNRPLVGMLMLAELNRAPTSEARVNGTYAFWVRGQLTHMLHPYAAWCKSVELYEQMYSIFLNASDNRLIPGVAREQNFPREAGIEILGAGPDIVASDELLNTLSSLYAGLDNGRLKPEWQEPGPFNITIGDLSTTIQQTPGTLGAMEAYIDWKAVHPKTAEYQIWRMLWPILGNNLTPKLHHDLIEVWVNSGGSQRAMLQAMVMHNDAHNPQRGACGYRWTSYVRYMNKYALPFAVETNAWPWQSYCGIDLERAADAKGTERSDEQAGAAFMEKIGNFPGTNEMREASIGGNFLFV